MFPDLSHLNLFKLLLYAAPHPLPTRIGGGGHLEETSKLRNLQSNRIKNMIFQKWFKQKSLQVFNLHNISNEEQISSFLPLSG